MGELGSGRSETEKERWGLLWGAAIEEYKSLRSEVIAILDRQYSMLYWAISSVALMLAAILNSWDRLVQYPDLLVCAFFIFLPAVSTAFVLGWSHLIVKIARLGAYIYGLEVKLSRILGPPQIKPQHTLEAAMKMPISWEHTLWRREGQEFIDRVTVTLKWSVALLYLLFLSNGSFLFLWRLRSSFAWLSMPHAQEITLGVTIFWAATWFFVFRFIYIQLAKSGALRSEYDRILDAGIPSESPAVTHRN